jgi:hypothetical protein
MAKAKQDIILRDRLQFTLTASGDLSLVYGRIDLSDYVNVVKREGLLVKDIYLQVRDPTASGAGNLVNTGIWTPIGTSIPNAPDTEDKDAWKVFVSTRAYENAADVGIASPDVLHIEEWAVHTLAGQAPSQYALDVQHTIYPTRDYHPGGYPVVSDLLVGIAVDSSVSNDAWDNDTLEIDIMLIAETTTVTSNQMTQLLTQAQDL